jgi:hypothetical protein
MEGTLAYEIDKYAGYYVALGAKELESEVQPLEQALDELSLSEGNSSNSKIWSEATEEITIGLEDEAFRRLHRVFGGEDTFTMQRLEHVVSRMISYGDVEYVQEYIQTSTEASILLLGVNGEGKSALSMTACEKYPEIIKLLLENGAHTDHQDKNGRTALMEAALWGRIENVNHLLQHGADAKLRDNNGHRAIDLATSSNWNDEERYERSGGDVQVYKEDTFIANQARRVIVSLLKPSTEPRVCELQPSQDLEFATHSFKSTSRGTIELIAPIAEFRVPKKSKTIASLQRPSPFPHIAAMSGWGHDENKITVSGRQWTDEVMWIASIVGHRLQGAGHWDQGREGRFHATHAEKQLIAYFIHNHVLIDTEDEELLRRAKPPVVLKWAVILVSESLCGDCTNFIKIVNKALGLDILVLDRSEDRGRKKDKGKT